MKAYGWIFISHICPRDTYHKIYDFQIKSLLDTRECPNIHYIKSMLLHKNFFLKENSFTGRERFDESFFK